MCFFLSFDDILAGAIIGSGIAVFTYHINFHHLWGDACGNPRVRILVKKYSGLGGGVEEAWVEEEEGVIQNE